MFVGEEWAATYEASDVTVIVADIIEAANAAFLTWQGLLDRAKC